MPKKIKWVYVIVSEKKNYLCCSKQIKKKIKRKKKVKKSDLTINHNSKSAQLASGYS